MIALTRMRLHAFVRTGRAVAPLIAALAVLSILYGGGQAEAREAYGVSALVVFPVLAWQTKILLDVEPDVQRRLARVALGSARREIVAGLLAAATAGLGTIAVALAVPWISGGVKTGPDSLPRILLIGLGVHLLALGPAVVLGALSSRAVTRTAGTGAAVLVTGSVLAIVLGLQGSPAPWLVPPLMAATRFTTSGGSTLTALTLTAHAALWTAATAWAYAHLRRTRT
ncbi:hypothetical protein [Catellatospora citrea]|uniref:Uncharacterized protein n=1 Tax=Catellatospora citrea TaxID=53366 RepID=A0A8J3K8M9_9ACTN|nr:hypothetical protein [Catellatospora citrea]RKE06782.1 hypothetical protein C8E86_1604 [Catellatospora citrea]GIF94927.1 hypothetical protein Cci01nite_00210 [Catellatospora citrea]